MTMNDKRPVIVGGGIAGLSAGLMLCEQGLRPILLESTDSFGGLLRSEIRSPFGAFDIGSHVVSETGIAELDQLLFDHIDPDEYCLHESLPNGTYFNGVSSGSGFIDTRALTPELYEKGLSDFFQTDPVEFDPDSTAMECAAKRYGATFTDEIIAPVLERLFGEGVQELNSRALSLVGLRRLLVGEATEALKWKQESAWNDERMCFHSVKPGNAALRHYYSKKGGVGKWVLDTVEKLKACGADLLPSTKVARISLEDGEVVQISLSNGEQVACNQLVWCAPVYPIFGLTGQEAPSDLQPPRLCAMAITDLVLSEPSPLSYTYLTCHDPKFQTFRVTNYQAMEQQMSAVQKEGYRFTIEEMRPPSVSHSPSDVSQLFDELCALGIANPKSSIVQSWQGHISNGFPVPTSRFVTDSLTMAQSALDLIGNLKIVGRGSGRVFFTSEVLVDLYNQLSAE